MSQNLHLISNNGKNDLADKIHMQLVLSSVGVGRIEFDLKIESFLI